MSLFLSSIDIENFRTFGKFSVTLPPVPGLTLLVATNGLGKSSFFDGIEWALTGKVRRFETHLPSSLKQGEYLTRRDAPSDSHRVGLSFGSNSSLSRTATSAPSAANVINMLKSPTWGSSIDDVSTFLAFTHFLGQASEQRFTSRANSDQWESLKGPSGIERLEEVRRALRGRPTLNAFKKRTTEQQRDIDDIEASIQSWKDMTDRLAVLREASNAVGELNGQVLEERVLALRASVGNVVGSLGPSPASGELVPLRELIVQEITLAERRMLELQRLEQIAEQFASVLAAANSESESLSLAKNSAESARREANEAKEKGQKQNEEFAAQAALVVRLQSEIRSLTDARAALERLTAAGQAKATLEGELSALLLERSKLAGDLAEATATLKSSEEQRAELAASEAQLNAARELQDSATELRRLEEEASNRLAVMQAAISSSAPSRARLPVLSDEQNRVSLEVTIATQRVRDATRKASELAAAVASIASHLGHHDQSCPVCATAFAPGLLKEIADRAASSQNLELAAAESELARLQSLGAQLAVESATVQNSIALADTAQLAGQTAKESAANGRRSLALRLGLQDDDDLFGEVQRLFDSATVRVAERRAVLDTNSERIAVASSQKNALEGRIAELDRGRQSAEAKVLAAVADMRAQREAFEATGHSTKNADEISNLIEARQATLANEEAKRLELSAQAASTSSLSKGAEEQAVAAEAVFSSLVAAAQTAANESSILQAAWTTAGMDGSPSKVTIDLAKSDLTKKGGALALLLAEHSALVETSAAVTRRRDYVNLTGEMDRIGGLGSSADPQTHRQRLETRLAAAKGALEATRATQEAVNKVTEALKQEADDFSTQFLRPLNDLIEDYNKALLSTPGESIKFNAAHAVDRTDLRMKLRYRDEIDDAIYNTDLPPQVVLSEGQMAANGFSILCAASTAYPWSSWRALLLDDPLQHNDIIHAAAFADLMRNLVELQGYQLIMSSHDRAEGEFFERKFEAAGLPCTIIELTAPSKEGVVYEPPRYNTAAQRALAELATSTSVQTA